MWRIGRAAPWATTKCHGEQKTPGFHTDRHFAKPLVMRSFPDRVAPLLDSMLIMPLFRSSLLCWLMTGGLSQKLWPLVARNSNLPQSAEARWRRIAAFRWGISNSLPLFPLFHFVFTFWQYICLTVLYRHFTWRSRWRRIATFDCGHMNSVSTLTCCGGITQINLKPTYARGGA